MMSRVGNYFRVEHNLAEPGGEKRLGESCLGKQSVWKLAKKLIARYWWMVVIVSTSEAVVQQSPQATAAGRLPPQAQLLTHVETTPLTEQLYS